MAYSFLQRRLQYFVVAVTPAIPWYLVSPCFWDERSLPGGLFYLSHLDVWWFSPCSNAFQIGRRKYFQIGIDSRITHDPREEQQFTKLVLFRFCTTCHFLWFDGFLLQNLTFDSFLDRNLGFSCCPGNFCFQVEWKRLEPSKSHQYNFSCYKTWSISTNKI